MQINIHASLETHYTYVYLRVFLFMYILIYLGVSQKILRAFAITSLDKRANNFWLMRVYKFLGEL